MKRLPIGIQTFSTIRQENYVYADKTRFLVELVEQGRYYFLSRPRRFGKSLFLDTLKAAFEGRKQLFHGLYAEHHWNWNEQYPVIVISFGGGELRNVEHLYRRIEDNLLRYEKLYDIVVQPHWDSSTRFRQVIECAYHKTHKQVVILVDEYDKPIIDTISETSVASEIRSILRGFYAIIKDSDAYIRFCFMTGVSKFSKVSLFSGLNNLIDITLQKEYSALCGYTESDIKELFPEELTPEVLVELRAWYNGYSWLGESVYNPHSVLMYMQRKEFGNYWSETGSPSFLVEMLHKYQYNIPALEQLQSNEEILNNFDIETISIEALLFQTGYLTIDRREKVGNTWHYLLRYPNSEVKQFLAGTLLRSFTPDNSATIAHNTELSVDLLKIH